jgi:hypothetical protein
LILFKVISFALANYSTWGTSGKVESGFPAKFSFLGEYLSKFGMPILSIDNIVTSGFGS